MAAMVGIRRRTGSVARAFATIPQECRTLVNEWLSLPPAHAHDPG
jgi:hypothetical protein